MKKHLQKLGVHKRKAWNTPKTNPIPLLFASFFGLVMVVYGVTRLLAANPVIYGMTPSSQTATAGQNKTVTIAVNPNGNTIRGGTVRVTFDANQFTFKSFAPTTGTLYTVFSQSNTISSLSFSFSANFSTHLAANLGVLTLQAKPVSATTTATLAFSAANTTAYDGFIFKPNNYAVQLGSATIALQPVSPLAVEKCSLDQSLLKDDPRCVPCPTNGSIIASNPACKSKPKPGTTQPTDPGNETPEDPLSLPTDDAPEQIEAPTVTSETEDEPEETTVATSTTKSPIGAILAIVGGVVLLGGGAFAFFMYRKPKAMMDLPPSDGNINAGLFDKPPAAVGINSASPVDDSAFESVTVEEDPAAVPDAPAEQVTAAEEPSIAQVPTTTPAPAEALPNEPLTPESQPQAVPTQPAPAASAAAVTDSHPEVSPAPASSNDEPADMFELAAEHPDSYGSAQLAEAENADAADKKFPEGNKT